MTRKAFTLIELLVVIAIIAILAAILFPVFAQAKQAAKKAASISNTKQLSLALIMYSTDFDDFAPIVNTWDDANSPLVFGTVFYTPWPWLVLPYMKNGEILLDPQAPAPDAISGWPRALANSYTPQYGYNYTVFSPLIGPTPTTSVFTTKSFTAPANPAETPLLAAKFSTAEDTLGATTTYWYGARSITSIILVDPPDCATIPSWCFDNWGRNGFWELLYLRTVPAGQRTGGVSRRQGDLQIIAWSDGHTSAKAPGAMAVGTNWTNALNASALIVNDQSKYLWDLL
jgi:prepilin-type N-terminal cleavage/methylation domain-containing protein